MRIDTQIRWYTKNVKFPAIFDQYKLDGDGESTIVFKVPQTYLEEVQQATKYIKQIVDIEIEPSKLEPYEL